MARIDPCMHGLALVECTICSVAVTVTRPMPTPEPDVLTVEQAADFLQMGRRAIYEAIGRGEVPHRRIGRAIRLSRAALTKWLDARPSSDDTGRRSCGAASKGMK